MFYMVILWSFILESIPLYKYTIVNLSILLFTYMWGISNFWLMNNFSISIVVLAFCLHRHNFYIPVWIFFLVSWYVFRILEANASIPKHHLWNCIALCWHMVFSKLGHCIIELSLWFNFTCRQLLSELNNILLESQIHVAEMV